MKKLLAVMLSLVMLAALGGCAKKLPKPEKPDIQGVNAELMNPITELTNIDEVNAAADAAIPRVPGAQDESFCIIAGETMLGQYKFTLNGAEYTVRAGKTDKDITGVYTDGGTLTDGVGAVESVEPTAFSEGIWARWFNGETQYTLVSSNASPEAFAEVYENLAK